MIKKLIVGVFVLSFGAASRAETTVVTNGTTVTITVDSGEYTFPTRFDDNTITKIVKNGAGTLNFGVVTNRFAGCNPEFEINAGIVKGIHGYNNVNGIGGSFGRTKSFTIAKGAQLYFLDEMKGSTAGSAHVTTGYNATDGKGGTWVGAADVTVAGVGPDGTGAIRRPNGGGNGGHDLFGAASHSITLTDDAALAADSRWGIGSTKLYMNGHDLLITGGNQFEFARGNSSINFMGDVGNIVVTNSNTQLLIENTTSAAFKFNSGVTPKVILRNAAALRLYGSDSPFPVEVSPGAAASMCFGFSGSSGTQKGPISILGTQLTFATGNGSTCKTYISGGITGNTAAFTGSNYSSATPIYIEGDNAVDVSTLSFSKPTPVQITNRRGVNVRNTLSVQDANVSIANASTNGFGAISQASGTLSVCGATNRIGSITLADGTFALTNAVYNEIGGIVCKAKGNSFTLEDAGLVVLTNRVKGESWNASVPQPATSPIFLPAGNAFETVQIPCFRIKGKTVVTGLPGYGANAIWGGCIGMSTQGQWDRAILAVSDGAVMTNNIFIGGNSQSQMGAVYVDGAGSEWCCPGMGFPGHVNTMTWLGRNSVYAYLGIDHGGTFTCGGYLTVGQSGRGLIVMRDGTINYGNQALKLSREGMGYAQYCQLGGVYRGGPAGTADVWMGFCDSISGATGSTTVFTIDGRGTTQPTADVSAVYGYVITDQTAGRASTAIVNIGRGATLSASRVCRNIQGFDWNTYKGYDYKNSPMYVNFNGGTLKAKRSGRIFEMADTGTVDPSRFPTRITVFEGGAAIDTAGFDVTASAPFLKPYGKGVKSITLTDAQSTTPKTGIGARRIRITGATGEGADAITDFDLSTRADAATAIVTSPGFGYGDDAKAQVESVKNYNTLYDTTLVMEELATTGGFTKKGAGTLTMGSTNTWGGVTRIEAGSLAFTHADGLPAGTTVEIASSALTGATAPLKVVKYTGGEIHITGAKTTDLWSAKMVTVLTSDTAMATLPTVKVFDENGQPLDTGDCVAVLANGGKSIRFGLPIGMVLMFK